MSASKEQKKRINVLWRLADLVRETLRGKSLGRIYSNWLVGEYLQNVRGYLIDLGGCRASHERYWTLAADARVVTVNNDETVE